MEPQSSHRENKNLETITYSTANGVAHVGFAAPEAANAIGPTFAREFRQVALAAEFDDSVRAVSVTAEGKIFCGGGDLKTFAAAGAGVAQLASDMLVDLHGAIFHMNRMPKPWVAGVRGAAGGAGLSLVSAFDLVVCGQSAKFTMAYTRAGVTPDGTSSYFLARHIGLRRMLDLTLTNRVLSATEAESWGLVNRVVADDEVDTSTAEMAQALADGAAATGMAKRVIYEGFESPLEAAAENEAAIIAASMRGNDAKEGIAAFAEKRAPKWEHQG